MPPNAVSDALCCLTTWENAEMDPRPGRFYALPPQERDKFIVQLRNMGWTYKRIGKHPQIGMSESGVKRSIDRILAGGFGQGISRV
jgi:hypothetical protein